MHSTRMLAVVVVAGLVAAPASEAQRGPKQPKPPKGQPNVSIQASPSTIVFGGTTRIQGRLRDLPTGTPVTLLESPHPFTAFTPAATTTVAANGDYSFTRGPRLHTRYQVLAPTGATNQVGVNVAIRLTLRVNDSTVRRGARVRFSGTASPEHDGRVVYIQRRTRTGGYRTVRRTTLRDAGAISRFSRRIRVFRDRTYRARVLGDADHATGTSRTRTIDVR